MPGRAEAQQAHGAWGNKGPEEGPLRLKDRETVEKEQKEVVRWQQRHSQQPADEQPKAEDSDSQQKGQEVAKLKDDPWAKYSGSSSGSSSWQQSSSSSSWNQRSSGRGWGQQWNTGSWDPSMGPATGYTSSRWTGSTWKYSSVWTPASSWTPSTGWAMQESLKQFEQVCSEKMSDVPEPLDSQDVEMGQTPKLPSIAENQVVGSDKRRIEVDNAFGVTSEEYEKLPRAQKKVVQLLKKLKARQGEVGYQACSDPDELLLRKAAAVVEGTDMEGLVGLSSSRR